MKLKTRMLVSALWVGMVLLGTVPPTLSQEASRAELVKKCGSEVAWKNSVDGAKEEAKEGGRLILWYVYAIEGGHIRKKAELDRYMKIGVFTDPELVAFVQRKFVALRLSNKTFGKELGIKALDFFEPGLVILNPEGEVFHKIHSIRTVNADFFMELLRAVLKKNPEFNKPSKDLERASARVRDASQDGRRSKIEEIEAAQVVLAEEYLKDGDYEKADKMLQELMEGAKEKGTQARANYLSAIVKRRLRKGAEALEALKKARELAKDNALKGDIAVEEALVTLKQGKIAEAKALYEKAVKDYPDCPRVAEAQYYWGVTLYHSQQEKEAFEQWKALAEAKGDSPWAWRAESNLVKGVSGETGRRDGSTGESPLMHAIEDVSWLSEEVYRNVESFSSTQWKRSEKDVDDIAKRAVEFLLKNQWSDSAWHDTRYDFALGSRGGPKIMPNNWSAISALAASALLEWRDVDPQRIDAALERAEKFLMDEKHTVNDNELNYAHCYRLLYFAKRLGSVGKEHRDKLLKKMNELVEKLGKIQRNGYWAHEYPNPFCTATVVHCLEVAKKAGAKVPEEMISKGASAIKKARGGQNYDAGQGASILQAAGRLPLSKMAMYYADKAKVEDVKKALDTFFKYSGKHEKARKSDYHVMQLDAVGGFFYWHNFFPDTEAVKILPHEEQREYFDKFLKILVEIPEMDGAYVDSHELGRVYGTSMALLSLKNCMQGGKGKNGTE